MPDLPDTFADIPEWKPLPVPTEDVNLICQGQPITLTFKDDPETSQGFILRVGQAIRLKSGDAGHIRPAEGLGGVAVFEVFG